MGTRGLIGFRFDGKEILIYNHYDSYPEGLGQNLTDEISEIKEKHGDNFIYYLKQQVRKLRAVTDESLPTKEDIEYCKKWMDPTASIERFAPDWYTLLRNTQGSLNNLFKCGIYEVFTDSCLIAEFMYTIDLETEKFIVLAQHRGNFVILKEFPLQDIPFNWTEDL